MYGTPSTHKIGELGLNFFSQLTKVLLIIAPLLGTGRTVFSRPNDSKSDLLFLQSSGWLNSEKDHLASALRRISKTLPSISSFSTFRCSKQLIFLFSSTICMNPIESRPLICTFSSMSQLLISQNSINPSRPNCTWSIIARVRYWCWWFAGWCIWLCRGVWGLRCRFMWNLVVLCRYVGRGTRARGGTVLSVALSPCFLFCCHLHVVSTVLKLMTCKFSQSNFPNHLTPSGPIWQLPATTLQTYTGTIVSSSPSFCPQASASTRPLCNLR